MDMMEKLFKIGILGICLTVPGLPASSQVRYDVSLDNWEFSRDSLRWEPVKVPHDWAISGPFDKKWDLQKVAIVQNGETQATEKTGRSGALPWIGEGWYRTSVVIPPADDGIYDFRSHAELWFDGAMSEPVVYVNGSRAGYWPYGYNAFRVDISPYLNNRGEKNEVLVHLRNMEESSRWYPGGGLYRPVRLVSSSDCRLDDWSVYFRTVSRNADETVVGIDIQAVNALQFEDMPAFVRFMLLDEKGTEVASQDVPLDKQDRACTQIKMSNPRLWSPETPYLYTLVCQLYCDNTLFDELAKKVGVRVVKIDKERGFQLNGESRKLRGVCLHHDLGPLGAAVNKDALIRQVKILKEMGCDAIRTAHNMPSTMQMEVYDSLGMMVMAESFDMWIYPKCKNGYARFFREWADKDITNLVLNHRNHASLIMYSIGNEIPEQWSEEGVKHARHLQELCHRLDSAHMVTQGIDQVDNALKSGFAQVMDVPGFNYRVHRYTKGHDELPQGFLLGSETASTISSRGVYRFPVVVNNDITYPDGQVNGYDNQYCPWSNLPETDFMVQDDYPWTIGQFVWTGFDYLGEPTPYDEYWPSRSSYFGICDLAGIPKDRYYLYRSQWNKKSHTVHLLPHWTWPGREGEVTPVYCYADGAEGELFINGKSQGRIKKDFSKHAWDIQPDSVNLCPLLDRYRLRWNHVRYEPGELRVVAYDSKGNKIGEDVRRTAGAVAGYRIDASQELSSYDGSDLLYLTVSAVDANGIEVPDADNALSFLVSGNAEFKAVCNGDATSLESFTKPRMRLFKGKLVITLKRSKPNGHYKLRVTDGRIKTIFSGK